MKPPFMMLKSTSSLIQDASLLPAKKSGEAERGNFSSLFCNSNNQPTKRFLAPKPPKKRYLEENYSQNKVTEHVVENDLNVTIFDKSSDIHGVIIADGKKKKIDENLLFPDVNPILPDIVPKTECTDIESRKSWRKKLLCWEKLDEFETPSCHHFKPETENGINSISLENEPDIKTNDKLNNHCPKEINTAADTKPGRRGRARACKGQKYREFMWTNIMHQRRKSSRWELCQDTVESAACDVELPSNDKSKDDLLNNLIISPRSSSSCIHRNSLDHFYKKKKLSKKKVLENPDKKLEVNKSKAKVNESPKKKLLKRENNDQSNISESGSNYSTLIGSKKRKLRRQSIRRLEPGSKFKDTRVVEDAGLTALAAVGANKMKLRKLP